MIMSFYKSLFHFFVIGFLVVTLTACQTKKLQIQNINRSDSEQTQNNDKEDTFKKFVQDFEANKFTETEANQAFLIAKSYEFDNKLDKAEKLLEIANKFSPNINLAINLIQIKIALKKMEEAKDIAKYTYVLFPNNSDILIVLIQIYQIENNLVQTEHFLDIAYKKYPKNESIVLLYASYNVKNAKQILENFVLKNPNSSNALFKLSTIYFREKKYDLALKNVHKSYSTDSENIDAIVLIAKINEILKKYTEAEKYYKIAFEKDMENNYNAQNYVHILLLQKKQQVALSILLKLEASSDIRVPFPPAFSFEIGRILILNGDYTGAKKRFESLLDPQYSSFVNHDEVLYFLAYCDENLHLFQNALDSLNKISLTSPLYFNVQKEKILVYINNKEDAKALELMNHFIYSKDLALEEVLFQTSLFIYFKDNKAALDLINLGIENNKFEKELYLKRIEIYIRENKEPSFIVAQAKYIVKKWPNYADGLNLLGYLLVENYGNSKSHLIEAEKLLKKALSLEKENPYYLDSLGCLYLKKNNLALAQSYFIQSLKYSSNEPVILFHYAKVLKLLNNNQDALKNIEKARTIISNMLIYAVESDYELKALIAANHLLQT